MEKLDKHYGIRLCCIILVWCALGSTIMTANNSTTFFSALILYCLPLALDYNSQMPKEQRNKRRQSFGFWSTILLATVFFGISVTGFNFNPLIKNHMWFHIAIWLLCLFFVFLAAVDWVAYSSPEEIRYREQIKQLQREKLRHEPMEKRVEYYKGSKNDTREIKNKAQKNETDSKTGTENE